MNGQHSWAVRQVLQQGYRVERMAVRMVLPEADSACPWKRRWTARAGQDDAVIREAACDITSWCGTVSRS